MDLKPASTTTSEQLLGRILDVIKTMDERLERLEGCLITNEDENEKSRQGGFPQFSGLPPELRRHIWAMCIPRRKLRIYNPAAYKSLHWQGFDNYPALGLSPPMISRVNRESRMVAAETGGMHRLAYKPEYWCQGCWCDFPPVYWTWFDYCHDILEIEEWCCPGYLKEPTGLWRLMASCATILVREKEVEEEWIERCFTSAWIWGNLKTILITPNRPEVVNRLSWGGPFVDEFFGLDSVVTVDLANREDVLQVRKRLSGPYSDFAIWFQVWQKKIGSGVTTQACAEAERVIKSVWTTATVPEPKPETDTTSTKEQDTARETVKGDSSKSSKPRPPFKSIPCIKTVYVFELEDERRPTIYEDFPARTWTSIRD